MALGFQITETMRGFHHFVDPAAHGEATDRPCFFRIRWGSPFKSALNPLAESFMHYEAEGHILVEGLTSGEVSCTGSLLLDYFGGKRIVYELGFSTPAGPMSFLGEKTDVDLGHPLQLIKTHTTCYGRITDGGGHIVSRSVLHFDPSQLAPFLSSFRLRIR